jgi:antitoxin component YwqK of YwqJK toxin-antitoxin module
MNKLLIAVAAILLSSPILGEQIFPQGEDSVTIYWPNGQIKEHYRIALHPERVEGDTTKLKIGLFQAWYDNGQLAEQSSYHFGECEGWYTSWYPSGRMKEKGYCFGKKQRTWCKWFENGTLAEETEYCAGLPSGRSIAWSQNEPDRVLWDIHYDFDGQLDGFCVWTSTPEHVAWEGYYWHGKQLIVTKYAGEQIHPFFEAGRVYNQKLDMWIVWDETWQHVSAGKEENGRRVGVWRHWMPNGDVFMEDYSKYCDH